MAEKTIAELSEDLITSLRRARDEIIKRGGTLSESAGLKAFPLAIRTMPADAVLSTVVVNEVSTGPSIPLNTSDYALLAEFGGITHRGYDEESGSAILRNEVFEGLTVYRNEDWEEISDLIVPKEILALEGYGEGINIAYYNKVDLIKKKYIRVIEKFNFDGSEGVGPTGWNEATTLTVDRGYARFEIGMLGVYAPDVIVCNRLDYTDVTSNTTGIGVDMLASTKYEKDYIAVRPPNVGVSITTMSDFMDWLKANPLEIMVARKVPIEEIDLQVQMNPIFKVEPDASIENDPWYGDGTATKIIFQTRTQ